MANYSPSIHIVRDRKSTRKYISTPNADRVFEELAHSYKAGHRAFNLIGSYGTGKSSFLAAFEQHLQGAHKHFHSRLSIFPRFHFIRVVGQYSSMVGQIAAAFDLRGKKALEPSTVIEHILAVAVKNAKRKLGTAILIDEFGKLLEYGTKNEPEKELYFIQQLAEGLSDPALNGLVITSLHQDFASYSFGLSASQRNEWSKVQGRFKEIPFNESLEQLLFVASQRLPEKEAPDTFKSMFRSIKVANPNLLRDSFNEDFARTLLPLDILSAVILTRALQRYGQNERSLFSFIEADDFLGLHDFNKTNLPYFSLINVFDYLNHNFFAYLNSKYNPDFANWSCIRTALQRVEAQTEIDIKSAHALIKVIGICNALLPASTSLDKQFLISYLSRALDLKNVEQTLDQLVSLKLIRFVNYNQRYVLFEGTDLDIEIAINEAGRLVEQVTDVVSFLERYFTFPCIPAKSVYYQKGTPRFFDFKLSVKPISGSPSGQIDGHINLIFNETLGVSDVLSVSNQEDAPILYGFYQNTLDIRKLLFEIEKVKRVREAHSDDRVAVRELSEIIEHQVKLLNHYVLDSFYSKSTVRWFYRGQEQKIESKKALNKLLSQICLEVYSETPIFSCELINRSKLSAAIRTARKSFLQSLMENSSEADFGFSGARFPPERTIYLSLLKATGMHTQDGDIYLLRPPTDPSFTKLWSAGTTFFENARSKRQSIRQLVDVLSLRPFKLKEGFLEFWVPVLLFMHRNDYALFHQGVFLPSITHDTLELICKYPEHYEIKVFNVDGVRLEMFQQYRKLLNQAEASQVSVSAFIETIRPFLSFYRSLPNYAKNTVRLPETAIAVRTVIASSKDPEKTFFEDFPQAMNVTVDGLIGNPARIKRYVSDLQESVRQLRSAFDDLLDRFEDFVLTEILGRKCNFPVYQKALQNRYARVKQYMLTEQQRTFYQRLNSPLDDRRSWLSSLAQVVINKTLEDFKDEDELALYEKLRYLFQRLDDYTELSNVVVGSEEVLKISITSSTSGERSEIVHLTEDSLKVTALIGKLQATLSDSEQLNREALFKLISQRLNGNS